MRSVDSQMNVCVGARPVAETILQRVAWFMRNLDARRIVVAGTEERQSQPSGEDGIDGDVGQWNVSTGRTSVETEVKGKHSGLGRPAKEVLYENSIREPMISAPPVVGVANSILARRVSEGDNEEMGMYSNPALRQCLIIHFSTSGQRSNTRRFGD
jgi:hypothetical protein